MTDDMMRELADLQRSAATLQGLLGAAQQGAPAGAEGYDATGTVRAHLGADGVPDSVELGANWQRRVPPERLGSAVVEACTVAAERRMEAWSQALADGGWRERVDRVRAEADAPTAGARGADGADGAGADVPPPPVLPVVTNPRPVGELVEDMLTAFDRVDEIAQQPVGPQGTGTGAYGKVTVTVSRSGMSSCVVDAQWSMYLDADTVTAALEEALAAARADLRAGGSGGPGPGGGLDRLLAEALALINDPTRLA
jgi:hypothetical protein